MPSSPCAVAYVKHAWCEDVTFEKEFDTQCIQLIPVSGHHLQYMPFSLSRLHFGGIEVFTVLV